VGGERATEQARRRRRAASEGPEQSGGRVLRHALRLAATGLKGSAAHTALWGRPKKNAIALRRDVRISLSSLQVTYLCGLRKRAAVCGFSRARCELGYKETEFHSVGTCRSVSGDAAKAAREAAHPQERGTRGADVRSPLSSASRRATGSLPEGRNRKAGSGREAHRPYVRGQHQASG
jgi:hypothetical protein